LRARTGWVLVALGLGTLLGCAGDPAGPTPPDPLATYFPLTPGNAWSFDADGALIVLRVSAREGAIAHMGEFSYEVRRDGIVRTPPGKYVLKLPLHPGATWDLPGGGHARIADLAAAVSTPAGDYTGCVVVEELTPEGGMTRTTFAPNVGPVDVLVHSRGGVTHAKLRGFTRAGDAI
jgi:hypothetical protein